MSKQSRSDASGMRNGVSNFEFRSWGVHWGQRSRSQVIGNSILRDPDRESGRRQGCYVGSNRVPMTHRYLRMPDGSQPQGTDGARWDRATRPISAQRGGAEQRKDLLLARMRV